MEGLNSMLAGRIVSRCLACLVLLTVLSAALWGQASSSLRGTVADPKGAVLPGAKVTISDPQNGFARSAVTNDRGEYQFLQVPPSTYRVTVAAPGFAMLKQEGLQLLVNTPTTQNFSMQVAAESVVMEVTGSAPLVNTQDATTGHAFGTEQIDALPFEGRDPVAILSLQPGVTFTGNSTSIDQDIDSRAGSVNGARSDQTNVSLDGVDNNDQGKGYAFTGALRSTLDSLQEFRVTTSNSNADSGRSSGAQVALVTKSGTNHFHGTVYEYHRPTFTTANDWFNKQAQLRAGEHNVPGKLIRNTFGATFGGPSSRTACSSSAPTKDSASTRMSRSRASSPAPTCAKASSATCVTQAIPIAPRRKPDSTCSPPVWDGW